MASRPVPTAAASVVRRSLAIALEKRSRVAWSSSTIITRTMELDLSFIAATRAGAAS